MERYPSHPVEDLTDEQLDKLLGSQWTFRPESQDNIINHVNHKLNQSKHHSKRKRVLIVAIAVVMVLLLMGFTNFDRIQQLMSQLFGASWISEYAMTLEESVTDQGFTMTGIAAVKDGDSTYLFVELKDEEGGRLTEDLNTLNYYVEGISKDVGSELAMAQFGCNFFSFDAETDTVILLFESMGDFQGGAAQMSLYSFMAGGRHEVDQTVDINLYEAVLQSKATLSPLDSNDNYGTGWSEEFQKSNMSETDIMHMNIGDMMYTAGDIDLKYISNIAFADGLLHIQVHATEYRACYLEHELRDKNGERVESLYLYEIHKGKVDSGYGDIMSEYIEYVYDIGDLENLKDMTIGIHGFYYENIYGGDWTIQMEMPEDVESREISTPKQITFKGRQVTVENIIVTPISVALTLDTIIGDIVEEVEVSVVLMDGRTVAFPETGNAYENGESGRYYCKYTGGVVDLDEVSEIIIEGESFSLTN